MLGAIQKDIFFAVEPSYGSSEDSKKFIDKYHIRVMMHAGFYHSEHPEESRGPEFNSDFENEQQREINAALKLIGDAIRFWIEEYHIDGMR
jgi:1,4-alpha-glucan branching enzyme